MTGKRVLGFVVRHAPETDVGDGLERTGKASSRSGRQEASKV